MTAILNPLVNPPPLQEQCVVTLHTLCKNVTDNPRDDRYRRVKATSRAMTQKVLACRGGEEFLNAAGWRKVALDYEGYYRCEDTVPITTLRCAEDVLRKNLQLCREKTERHERAKTKEKDDAARQKEEARGARSRRTRRVGGRRRRGRGQPRLRRRERPDLVDASHRLISRDPNESTLTREEETRTEGLRRRDVRERRRARS